MASQDPVPQRGPVERSNRLALAMGLIAISLTLLVGWLAFRHGRGTVTKSYLDTVTRESRWYASLLDTGADDKLRPGVLQYLVGNFQERSGRYADSRLVVHDEHGRVILDTREQQPVGFDASAVPLSTSGPRAPASLSELMEQREDWVGGYEDERTGRCYLAAVAFAHPNGEFVALFVPEDSLTLELDRASIPWLLGTLLVALLLMPLALLLLKRNFAHSIAWLEGTQASLRESEARLSNAIESLPCEFWIHGADGRVLLQNAQAVNSVGLMEGRTLAQCGVEEEVARFWADNCARALSGETFEIDYRRERGAGVQELRAIVGPVRSAEDILGVSVLKLDLTEHRLTEQKLAEAHREQARMNARLSVLHDIDRQVLQAASVEELLQFAIRRMCETLGCLRASVLLVDRDEAGDVRQFRLAAVGGAALGLQPPGSTFHKDSFTPDELEGYARGQAVEHTDLCAILDKHPEYVRLYSSGVRSMTQLPLTSRGRLLGTLNLSYASVGPSPREDVEIGREVALLLSVAIEHQRLGEALRQHAFELEQGVRERTQKLLEANAEMETYVHTVTHDLRAPLRAIQGFGLALVEDHMRELSPTARTYVERMIAGAERMDQLMRELLAYSRLGHLELHLQGVDLGAIEREAEALVASELEHSSAKVLVDGPLGEVRGHTPTLVQVMANLLSNAAKFVPEGCQPEIRLRPEPRGARLRLWVEDNGIGIPPEARERIWGVFERLHGTDTYPGTGLGLAIVRRALERMHGTCGVESEPGAGSRFWIELDSAGQVDGMPPRDLPSPRPS